jgi:hypothetical protein
MSPKLKPSTGMVKFRTVVPEEFQRWLFYELANIKEWNQDKVTMEIGFHSWYATFQGQWEISWDGKEIQVASAASKVILRKGLEIWMGSGRLVIEGEVSL